MERGPSQEGADNTRRSVSSSSSSSSKESPTVGAHMARTAWYSVSAHHTPRHHPTHVVYGRSCPPTTASRVLVGPSPWRAPRHLRHSPCNGAICPAGSGWLASGVERQGCVVGFEQAPWAGPYCPVHTLGDEEEAGAHPLSSPWPSPSSPACHQGGLFWKRGLGLGDWLWENPSEPACSLVCLEEAPEGTMTTSQAQPKAGEDYSSREASREAAVCFPSWGSA